jgi:hypothetical protein
VRRLFKARLLRVTVEKHARYVTARTSEYPSIGLARSVKPARAIVDTPPAEIASEVGNDGSKWLFVAGAGSRA